MLLVLGARGVWEMRIAVTLVLMVVAILALFLLLMGWLGVGVGVRASGNLFVDEVVGPVGRVSLILVTLAVAGGLYLLWRDRRRAG
jgi:hypothetical protein